MPSTPSPTSADTTAAAPSAAADPPPSTTTAVVARRYGGPEVLQVDTVPVPNPGKGEVLVRVAAAGISRANLHLLTGTPLLLRLAGFGLRRPKQPVIGIELSGVVAAVGPGCERLAVGDEVFGYGPGACAGYAVAKEAKLARKPTGLTFVQAAATVDSASTALQAVRERGGVRAGQRVLVLGASGGVGSFVVQLAVARGAEVTGTASAAKAAFVRSLGATEVIDHHAADPLATPRPYDVIIDLGGNRPVRALRRALAGDGTLVIVGGEGGGPVTGGFGRQVLAPLRGLVGRQRLRTVVAKEHHGVLEDLATLAAEGAFAPAVDRVHPLADAAFALARMEAGQIHGKDVVEVAPTP